MRFLISTLKPGLDPSECERWVRERDYGAFAASSYTVHRIRRPIDGAADAGWQCIERIEVANVEQHDQDLASPEGVALREELYGCFLDRWHNTYFVTDPIE